jgi:hypothetical protein
MGNDLVLKLSADKFLTADELISLLPHGSGIDCKWTLESYGRGVICHNSFHLMDENGYYCGYADFSVKIFHHKKDEMHALKGPCAGKVQVLHRKGDIDLSLSTPAACGWRRAVAFGIPDYLHESISYALRDILTHRHEIIDATTA